MKTYVHIPENLDTELLTTTNPPKTIVNFSIDRLNYLLGLFNSIPANNKDLEIVDGWIPFYSQLLKRVVPNYKLYFGYLEEIGVIECNNHYRNGKSRCYRLLPKYQTFLKPVAISNRAVKLHLKKVNIISPSIKKRYSHLVKWFNEGLQIDANLAFEFIKQDLSTERGQSKPEGQGHAKK